MRSTRTAGSRRIRMRGLTPTRNPDIPLQIPSQKCHTETGEHAYKCGINVLPLKSAFPEPFIPNKLLSKSYKHTNCGTGPWQPYAYRYSYDVAAQQV